MRWRKINKHPKKVSRRSYKIIWESESPRARTATESEAKGQDGFVREGRRRVGMGLWEEGRWRVKKGGLDRWWNGVIGDRMGKSETIEWWNRRRQNGESATEWWIGDEMVNRRQMGSCLLASVGFLLTGIGWVLIF